MGRLVTKGRDGTFYNSHWMEFVAETAKTERGAVLDNWVHPDDLKRLKQEEETALAVGRTYQLEYRLRRQDGEFLWVTEVGWVDQSGETPQLMAQITDVGRFPRKVREAKQELTEQRLSSLFEMAGHFGEDPKRQVRFILESGVQLMGLDCGVLSRIQDGDYEVYQVFDPNGVIQAGDRHEAQNSYCLSTLEQEAVLAIEQIGRAEKRIHPCYRDFKLASYIATPVHVDGVPFGTLNFFGLFPKPQPFSELDKQFLSTMGRWIGNLLSRHQLNRQLQESEERFQLAVDGSSAGIWDWHIKPERRIWWSPRFYELLGYEPGEVTASFTGFKRLLHPDDYAKAFSALKMQLNEGQPFVAEYRLKHKSGGFRWYEARGKMRISEEGEPLRILGSLVDIHDRKLAEAQVVKQAVDLAEAKDRADRANLAKSEFIAITSHELRTPINGILGGLEILEQMDLPADSREIFKLVHDCADSLKHIINDILDITKIESGQIGVELEEMNIEASLELIVSSYLIQAKEKGISLRYEISGGFGIKPIWTDPHRVRQILFNLVGNGVKFTETGEVVIQAADSKDTIVFEITDTGKGMSELELSQAFEPFFQGEESGTRIHGGVGLGLTIAKRLCDALQGKIEISSKLEAGTRVRVEIPKMELDQPI